MQAEPDLIDPPPDRGEIAPHPVAAARRAARPALTKWQDLALTVMLVLQIATLFVAAPLAALGYAAGRYSVDALVFAWVSLVVMISQRRINAFIAIAGMACGLASDTLRLVDPSSTIALPLHLGSVIGVAFCAGIVARALFAPGPVTLHRLRGAVVVYLNVALAFSMAYRLIGDFVPDAFAGARAEADSLRSLVSMIYFSFVTLTSTGFGDIVPVHPIARSLANLEAIIGQLFPATLVAVLVSQHLESRRG